MTREGGRTFLFSRHPERAASLFSVILNEPIGEVKDLAEGARVSTQA